MTTSTAPALTAAERMAAAVALLDAGASGSAHPRATAFLLRRALEGKLDTYLSRQRPALGRCRMQTKVVWLAHHLNPELAGRIAAVWSSLSGACHYQQYAMPPTVGELLSWYDEVAFVLRALPS
ncbi:hypothetical protein GCM10010521_75560 [Streptomyces rameus]|uniref:Uncharacterized protein n=1 Tax=Streptomyces rameus TaxID=68261 RepID=A0ABN3VCK1_9ACTN